MMMRNNDDIKERDNISGIDRSWWWSWYELDLWITKKELIRFLLFWLSKLQLRRDKENIKVMIEKKRKKSNEVI